MEALLLEVEGEVSVAVLFNDFRAHAGLESARVGDINVVAAVPCVGVGWRDFLAHAGFCSDVFLLSEAIGFGPPAVVGSLCFNAAVAHTGLESIVSGPFFMGDANNFAGKGVDRLAQEGFETNNDCCSGTDDVDVSSSDSRVDSSFVGKIIFVASKGTGGSELAGAEFELGDDDRIFQISDTDGRKGAETVVSEYASFCCD